VGLLTDCRRYGFSHVISSGNEAVTQLHDFLDWLVDDDATRVIALFVEAVRNIDAFTAALDRAALRGKPVVVLKVGKSERSKRAVMGHTGAVAGAGAAFSALLRRHRAIEVATPDELNEVLAACQSSRLPGGPRIGHITASGGQVNMILDVVERHGFQMPPLAPASAARLADGTGISAELANPSDAWGDGNWQRNLPLALEVVGNDPGIDAVVFTSDTADDQPMRPTAYVGMVKDAAAASDKPHYFFNTRPGLFRQENVEALRGTGAAVIGGVVQGLGAVHKLGIAARTPPAVPLPPLDGAPALPRSARRSISETDAKALLRQAGLRCTADRSVMDEADIPGAVAATGFPLVLKAVSDDIAHRSDHGLVRVGISDMNTLVAERERMLGILGRLGVAADLVVSEQVPQGVEVLVGVTADPELGACIAVGPGGVLVELLGDVALRPLPLCAGDAAAMIAETRLQKLLDGARGAAPADAEALIGQIETIARLARAWQGGFVEMDINPLIVLPRGQGTRIADAVIFPAQTGDPK
jgi:acyl-CoA synthetase (NDP forming)